MKRCPECGQYSEDDASFCPRCGRILPDRPDFPDQVTYAPVYKPKRSGPSVGTVVAVVAVVAILLAVSISFLDIFDASSEYKDKTLTYSWKVPSIEDSPEFSVTVKISADEMRNNQFCVGCSSLFFSGLYFQQFVFQCILPYTIARQPHRPCRKSPALCLIVTY